jgi:hypothetical protein
MSIRRPAFDPDLQNRAARGLFGEEAAKGIRLTPGRSLLGGLHELSHRTRVFGATDHGGVVVTATIDQE